MVGLVVNPYVPWPHPHYRLHDTSHSRAYTVHGAKHAMFAKYGYHVRGGLISRMHGYGDGGIVPRPVCGDKSPSSSRRYLHCRPGRIQHVLRARSGVARTNGRSLARVGLRDVNGGREASGKLPVQTRVAAVHVHPSITLSPGSRSTLALSTASSVVYGSRATRGW